jgi:chemotaxis protein MotB
VSLPVQPRAGQDRWLVSYADFITLLLAFFTVLSASSNVDLSRAGAASASVKAALDHGIDSAGPRSVPVAAPVRVVPSALDALEKRLRADLANALLDGRVEMTRDPRGLVLSLPEQATFAVGSADVTPEAARLIAQVAGSLVRAQNAVRVEGHTDDVPIRTPRFASNWELSTTRASAVIALLVERLGFPPARLSAAGYGEFHPRLPNTSPENRARNRRIDLVVLDGLIGT